MLRLLILTILVAGCRPSEIKPVEPEAVPMAARRLSESSARVKSVYYPDVSPGGGVHCSLYYCKPKTMILRARRFREELEIGMRPDLNWFWMRSHDPQRAYVYPDEDAMLVRDIFRPDMIARAMGVDEIDSEWKPSEGLAVAELKEGDHERRVFMDSEKIVRQEIWRDGAMVASVDVLNFNRWGDVFLPREIRIKSQEGERTVDLGDVQVNKGEMTPVPCRPTKRL